MRLVIIVPALAGAGCVYSWEPVDLVIQECTPVPFFVDNDGDGWGDPAADPEDICPGSEAATGKVRNNRDCDDEDPDVTGRTGSICPADLVLNDPVRATDYTATTLGTSEFVVVHTDTDLVWAAAAEDACGPIGWGGIPPGGDDSDAGHLATFTTESDLRDVLSLAGVSGRWAGYVGFRPEPGSGSDWGHRDLDDHSVWVEDEGFAVSSTRFCSPAGRDAYTDDLLYLALIRDVDTANATDLEWCLGVPADVDRPAPPDPPVLPERYGYFICERPVPDPKAYEIAPE